MNKNTKIFSCSVGRLAAISAAIGSFTCFILIFVSSSPLITGGVVGAICESALIANSVYCNDKKYTKNLLLAFILFTVTTAAGVGIGAGANCLFPNVMSGMVSAALVGAVIGIIGWGYYLFYVYICKRNYS